MIVLNSILIFLSYCISFLSEDPDPIIFYWSVSEHLITESRPLTRELSKEKYVMLQKIARWSGSGPILIGSGSGLLDENEKVWIFLPPYLLLDWDPTPTSKKPDPVPTQILKVSRIRISNFALNVATPRMKAICKIVPLFLIVFPPRRVQQKDYHKKTVRPFFNRKKTNVTTIITS